MTMRWNPQVFGNGPDDHGPGDAVRLADAEATRIYADAFGRDAEFYQFLRTLEAYPRAIDSLMYLFLGTDSEFYRYLRSSRRQ